MTIPPGLVKCDVCGQYKGTTLAKYLTHGSSSAGPDPEHPIPVLCLCDGITCRHCGINKIHRPSSNSYDAEHNTVRHHPYFAKTTPCRQCADKEGQQWPRALGDFG